MFDRVLHNSAEVSVYESNAELFLAAFLYVITHYSRLLSGALVLYSLFLKWDSFVCYFEKVYLFWWGIA